MAEDRNEILTKEETDLLNKTTDIRVRLLDALTDGVELRTLKVGEIRVLNEVLAATEKNVHDKVNNRIKHQAQQDQSAVADMVAGVLMSIGKKKAEVGVRDHETKVGDELKVRDFVDGELEIDSGDIELSDIVRPRS